MKHFQRKTKLNYPVKVLMQSLEQPASVELQTVVDD